MIVHPAANVLEIMALPIGDRRLSVVAGPEFGIGPKVGEVAALIARAVDRLRQKPSA